MRARLRRDAVFGVRSNNCKLERRDDRGTIDSRGHRRHHDRAMGDSDSDASGKLFIGGVSWQTTEVRRLACTPLQARAPNSACVRLL